MYQVTNSVATFSATSFRQAMKIARACGASRITLDGVVVATWFSPLKTDQYSGWAGGAADQPGGWVIKRH